jgi:hypothetical protein
LFASDLNDRRLLRLSPPMPAPPASARCGWNRNLKRIEIIMAREAGRISIGEWS